MSRTKGFQMGFFLSSSSSLGTYILHHWVLFIGVLWAPVRAIYYVFVWAPQAFFPPLISWFLPGPPKNKGWVYAMHEYSCTAYGIWYPGECKGNNPMRWMVDDQDIRPSLPSCILFFTIELNIYERSTILFVCWRFDILD